MQVDVQAPCEVGHGRVNPFLVFLVDDVVAVEVFPTDAAKAGAVLCGVVVDLFLALEHAVIDITYLRTHGMAYDALHAVAAECAVGGDGLGQFGHLIPIGADVAGDVVLEVADVAAVAHVELHTFVHHLAGVDPL